MGKGIVLQGFDILEMVSLAVRKNKKFQALMLNQIEEILGKDTEEYLAVRKIVLDGMNNYKRVILRTFFGDIEG